MSSHWLHWKAKSSLWALPVSNWGVYHKIHLVTFLYIFLLVTVSNELPLTAWKVKSSLWALPVSTQGVYHKIHLVTFLYIFLLVDCFKWALIDCIESEEFTLCSASFKCKIHLMTFFLIFLLVDCFKWALIDCIEKQRVHPELCQFPRGGIIRFTWWHFFISSY